ncbi:Exocyst protein Sec3 [Klebsormidium nitens]|uniref:Exocyst protein Sec3 n=1 Tax=Klebsormidium nitens TaxID=105231 RepID=A0A1Y1IKM4_KLENI|nr:Exocyst protein Sec3 [Klebsormidium nitens]|eukprot:GAQ91420.1 Exocyst protein Sec3 [Klebsormidium nitens]
MAGAADGGLVAAVEALFAASESSVVTAVRLAKSAPASAWNLSVRRNRVTSKPRVLAVTAKRSPATQRFKVNLHVIKQSNAGLQVSKTYKLKHLVKIEALPGDAAALSFFLRFDNAKPGIPVPQWTARTPDDRNLLVVTLLRLCRENGLKLPVVVGLDVVEMALWAQAHAAPLPAGAPELGPPMVAGVGVAVGGGAEGGAAALVGVGPAEALVSAEEEAGMAALLGSYTLGIGQAEAFSERLRRELAALEAANVHAILESEPLVDAVLAALDEAAGRADDMDETLAVFNTKLRHMREDIEAIELRNNRLEQQAENNGALLAELAALLARLRVPPEFSSLLLGGPFEEPCMAQNMEAARWLTQARAALEPPALPAQYAGMQAVREKRAELERLRSTWVRRATDFLRTYLAAIADPLLANRAAFSQRGALKRPDHSELRYRCRAYAPLLQHLKELDPACLPPLRQAYCHSLNSLLRREARAFAEELRASSKLVRTTNSWLENLAGAANGTGGPALSPAGEAYTTMLRTFVPLIVDESNFFAGFMCFDVEAPSRTRSDSLNIDLSDDETDAPAAPDGKTVVVARGVAEQAALAAGQGALVAGLSEDFVGLVDWACRLDAVQAITLDGITEAWLASHGTADHGSPAIAQLLADCADRIRASWAKFIEEVTHQIERYDKGLKQAGVLPYIPRFALLAGRMEQLVQGGARDAVDGAYERLVGTMFAVLHRIAAADPKHAPILLLENYAAFQNSTFDLANSVPALAVFYQQASDAYEQACADYVHAAIAYQFGKLFQFGERIKALDVRPEEVPFSPGFSKADLRKLLKSTLAGVEKQLGGMYKRMAKHLTADDLLPSLWDKAKEEFLAQYEDLEALLAQCYPSEQLSPSSPEMRELFRTV